MMYDNNKTVRSDLLSTREVARRLAISTRKVLTLRSDGKLPDAMFLGRTLRWKVSDIDLFLACNCSMAAFTAKKGQVQ